MADRSVQSTSTTTSAAPSMGGISPPPSKRVRVALSSPPSPTHPTPFIMPETYNYTSISAAEASVSITSAPVTFMSKEAETTLEQELAVFQQEIQEDLQKADDIQDDIEADIYDARWEAEEEEERGLEKRLAVIQARVRGALYDPASKAISSSSSLTSVKRASEKKETNPQHITTMFARAVQDDLSLLFDDNDDDDAEEVDKS